MKLATPFKIAKRYSTPQFIQYALTWRISLLCALMAVVAMIYEIPESAISCYLIIYLMKIDATQNIIVAIAITVLLSLTVIMIFIITNLVINSPFLIFIAIFCCSYFLVLLGGIFNITEVGNLLALVVAFLLTLLTNAPTGNIATRGLLYALLMAVSPMLLMIIFNLIFGKKSQNILLEKYAYQLSVIEETLTSSPNKSNNFDLLLENISLDCESHLKMMKLLRLKSKEALFFFENCNSNLYKLLALSTLLPKDTSIETRHVLIEHCKKLSLIIKSTFSDEEQIENFKENILLLNDNLVVSELCKTLKVFFTIPHVSINKNKKNENETEKNSTLLNHQFAFKTTISAVLCYFIYAITDWQGIHTAMITCYVVALGTTAETIHKLILRIIGCLFGALIGVLTIIYIVPHIETINALFILVFLGILIPAWITSGSELFSYCGVQIGLAFLLTVINGFQPSTDLMTAQDRILGILLGNVICFFVFTYLWPVSISDTIYLKINNLLTLFKNNKDIHGEISKSIDIVSQIKNIDYDLKLVIFETKLMKLSIKELKIIYILIRRLLYFNSLLLLPIESKKDNLIQDESFTFKKSKLIDTENINKLNKILNKNIISIIKRI